MKNDKLKNENVVENITAENSNQTQPFKYKYNIFHIEKSIYDIEPDIADVDAVTFGQAVKIWREKNGIRQKDICGHCDVELEWIYDLEQGEPIQEPRPFFRLLYAMDVKPEDIEKLMKQYTCVKQLFAYWYDERSLEYQINMDRRNDMDRVKDIGMLVQVAMQTEPK